MKTATKITIVRFLWGLSPEKRRFYLRHRRRGVSHDEVVSRIESIESRRRDDRGTINLMW